jgi:hypothetical protein
MALAGETFHLAAEIFSPSAPDPWLRRDSELSGQSLTAARPRAENCFSFKLFLSTKAISTF